MHSRCDPPKFDQQDWSQFDFSRWHLDGVTLDTASAIFAGLSERLFNSEEWRQHFQTSLPTLEREGLNFFKGHSQQLRGEKDAIAKDFDKRIAVAQKRNVDFRKSVEAAAAPPIVQASPNLFHLAVKVTSKEMGLPGLVVQITDPRNEKLAMVHAVTDLDGNAILTISEEIAKEVDKRDMALEVLSPGGKTLMKLPGAVCVRLNQVETKVITLADSPKIEPHKNAALGIRSEREARVANLATRIETLKQERETRLHDLDCRLDDNQKIIAGLEQETAPTPRPSNPASEQAARPQTKPSKEERPPAGKKGRKKP